MFVYVVVVSGKYGISTSVYANEKLAKADANVFRGMKGYHVDIFKNQVIEH